MAIRLFAHTLMRGSETASSAGASQMTFRRLDFGRWVLGGLVVRRAEPMAWGLPQAAPQAGTGGRSDPRAADAIWADTQPFWYE